MTQTEHDTRQNEQNSKETRRTTQTSTHSRRTPSQSRSHAVLSPFPRNDRASRDTRVTYPRPPPLVHTYQRRTRSHRQNTKRAKMGTKYMNISESCSRAGRAYAAMHSNIPTDTTNGATTPRQRRRRPRTTTHHVHTPEPTRQPAKTRDSHARTRAQEHR